MARDVVDYVALALIADIGEDSYFGEPPEFSGDLKQLRERATERMGFAVSDAVIAAATRTLVDCGLLRITADDYSGTFVKIKSREFSNFIQRAAGELEQAIKEDDEISIITKPSDYPNASALEKHELFEDYHELGTEWLKRALQGLRERVETLGSFDALRVAPDLPKAEAPASDRIVTFSDNEVVDLEAQATAIIDAVVEKNQIEGEPGLREILLGQLRAGRELIRAGSCRLYLLELSLIETLKFLVKRYEHEVVGGLAAALLTALSKHLGIEPK
jgi:hypothetical protein